MLLISKDERYWPLMSPLPSYGYGREHKGPRYGSLIHGQDLKDVTITGMLRFLISISYSFIQTHCRQIGCIMYIFYIQNHRKLKVVETLIDTYFVETPNL